MTQIIFTLARFGFLEARRTRIGWLALALLGTGGGLAWLTGQVAITETREIQAVLTASFLRFVAVFVMAAFIVSAQVREIADKGIDMLLSLPAPRSAYYLGKLLGYLAVAWTLALLFGLPLLLLAPAAGALTWTASLALELSIVVAASLFFVSTLAHAPAALAAVLGFYLLARVMAALRLIGGSSSINDGSSMIMPRLLDVIAALLPRLDLFTQSSWLAQPPVSAQMFTGIAAQALIYVALLSAAGLIDLHRKNF
ncbi:MAG: ABC transporter permease [Burkholderiales bacterium]|nr:ABC transporter permease [Burkholderiales bacterium]